MFLTGRVGLLAVVGALLVGLVAPGLSGLLAVEGALLLGIGLDVLLATSPKRLRLVRGGDRSVRLGAECATTLTAVNTAGPGRLPFRGLLRDAWPPSAGAERTRHRFRLPAGERVRLTTRLRPTRRGDRHSGPVTVRSTGPLGLAGRQRTRQVEWTVRALPPFHSRRHLPSRLARLRQLDGRNAALVRGQGTEFDSLREYVDGDDVRSIDWRATARGGNLTVRTWRPERDRHLLIVLDTSRTSAGRVGTGDASAPRLDAAMDAALLLAALASQAGDRVDLLAYDRRVRAEVRGGSRSELLPALVNAMARLEPELVEADATSLVSAVLGRAGRRSLVVLLTGLEAAVVEEGLLPVIGLLTSRHQVLVASVGDPRTGLLASGRGGPDAHSADTAAEGSGQETAAVYLAAAAERSLAERGRTSAALRRLGVEVLDASPEELPPALADRYLALKAAGRL